MCRIQNRYALSNYKRLTLFRTYVSQVLSQASEGGFQGVEVKKLIVLMDLFPSEMRLTPCYLAGVFSCDIYIFLAPLYIKKNIAIHDAYD